MPTNASIAHVEPRRLRFAGLPAESWAFALRIWLACLLALYASFWLQLEAPSSAAITVAILALPTRGQGMEKAGFRVLATVIGLSASIVIAGLFSQTDVLLLAVLSAWVGACVFILGLLDGNRAYAAALSCYTVALIYIQQIDSPQHIFAAATARGAAIAVGIFASWLINDVLAAPNYYPIVTDRLDALQRQIRDYRQRLARGEAMIAATAAGLLRDIASLRPDVACLVAESSNGAARSSAARSAMVNLASELYFARAIAALSVSADIQDDRRWRLMEICRTWLQTESAQKEIETASNLEALRTGKFPTRQWRAPLYRSRRIAAENGIRAAFYFAVAAALFVVTGWPTTELSLSLVAVVIGLGFTTPSFRMFTVLAGFVTPIASLLAGILKYVVFNGVSDFQLLAIGLAPVIIGLSLLISLPNVTLAALGRFSLIFTLAILMPANPQSYNPTTYVITCLLFCLATISVFVTQLIVPPLSDERRLALLLKTAARGNSRHGPRDLAPEEATFREATWVGKVVTASGASNREAIDEAMRAFDRDATLCRCEAELDRLQQGPLTNEVEASWAALTTRSADAMMSAAEALRAAGERRRVPVNSACATLFLASMILEPAEPIAGRSA